MIHQCRELGEYYRKKENPEDDALAQFANDPGAKFGNRVLLLQFSQDGLDDVTVKGYQPSDRLRFLYRKGPPNKWDATPTSGMPAWKPDKAGDFAKKVGTRLARLGNSIRSVQSSALAGVPSWEKSALDVMSEQLLGGSTRAHIIDILKQRHTNPKDRAFLSVAWLPLGEERPKYVGDFEAFRRALNQFADDGRSRARPGEDGIKGVAECAICGASDAEVTPPPPVYSPPLYTTDKPGSISGGFDKSESWRNCPTCRNCYEQIDFARERIKKDLSFNFYGFKYLVLPLAIMPKPSEFFDFLDQLDDARVNKKSAKKLISAEDDLSIILAQEDNRLQFDLLFFKSDPQSFRPALYIAGMLPSRFRELFDAKEAVESHPWCKPPSPKPFHSEPFTFKELHEVFYSGHKGTAFADDFLAATRAALEKTRAPYARLLQAGMRWVREDRLDGRAWEWRIAHLFRSLLFFEKLIPVEGKSIPMNVDYGDTEQADRVQKLFAQAPGKLKQDPAAQAAFLVGACCGRIETIQNSARGFAPYSSNAPFASKLKGFRLNEHDVRMLFPAAKEKAAAYGEEQERKVAGLLQCAGSALFASPDQWALSPDEVSYFVALGHALRPRLAKTDEETSGA